MSQDSQILNASKKLDEMHQAIQKMKEAIQNMQQSFPKQLEFQVQTVDQHSARLKKIEKYQDQIQEMKIKLPEQINKINERFGKEAEKITKIQQIQSLTQNLRNIVPQDIIREFEQMEESLNTIKVEISSTFEKQFRLPALKGMAEKIINRIVTEQFKQMTNNFSNKFIYTTQSMLSQVIEQLNGILAIGNVSDVNQSFSEIESGLKNTLETIEMQISQVVSVLTEQVKKESNNIGEFENLSTQLQQFRKMASEMEAQKSMMTQLINGIEEESAQLREEKGQLTLEKEGLTREKDQLTLEKEKLRKEKDEKEKEIDFLATEKNSKDEELGRITANQQELLKEYELLKDDLKKFQAAAALDIEGMQETEYNFSEIQNLLRIYMLLMEEIWQGQPHYKILSLLHGDKEELDRRSIKNATGIEGAMVLKAIHDMAKHKIITFDENTDKAKLIRRCFPKK